MRRTLARSLPVTDPMIMPSGHVIRTAVPPIALGTIVLALFLWNAGSGAVAAFAIAAAIASRTSTWLAVCLAAWAVVFLAVLTIPGPYDSSAGRDVIPVLATFAACFVGGWALGRRVGGRPVTESNAARPRLVWPPENRLRLFLLAILALSVVGAVLKFRGSALPLFADNPDVARELVRQRSNIVSGLLSEAWTLGLSISLLRALTGTTKGWQVYSVFTLVFTFGAALGASKNSVLVGIVPALVAALSVRRSRSRTKSFVKAPAIILIGLLAVGAAVVLGGQRTLAGTGTFEDAFRERYGDNALAASVASLDLSLSSSTETFGRLWAHREDHPPAFGRYSLTFTGSVGDELFETPDLYRITAQLSKPYYMNTATFAAIPLLDYGPIGAAIFLSLLGLCVGLVERRFEFSESPAHQLGRAFVIYYSVFGVYELYPLIQPFWLSLIPGLWCLYLISRPVKGLVSA